MKVLNFCCIGLELHYGDLTDSTNLVKLISEVSNISDIYQRFSQNFFSGGRNNAEGVARSVSDVAGTKIQPGEDSGPNSGYASDVYPSWWHFFGKPNFFG